MPSGLEKNGRCRGDAEASARSSPERDFAGDGVALQFASNFDQRMIVGLTYNFSQFGALEQ